MKSLKELDTSCKATFKNGEVRTFSSIEEASKCTGISITSIKIRCNKPGASGKDKTLFEWCNPHTAAHFRAKKSKNKGASFESEIVGKLREIGYANVCRSAGESKKLDNNKVDIADPSGELEVAIQAKHTHNTPNYFKIANETTDPREFILLWKKPAEGGSVSPGTLAIMDAEFFYKLLALYHKR